MKQQNTIIIVDDHTLFRDGLKFVIEKLPSYKVIAEADNGKQFLELLDKEIPDLVLMDIFMPVMNGIEAAEKAIEKYPDLKIITISMYGDQEYYFKMINAGVKGFILKQSGKNELENAMNEVINGGNYFSQELLCRIITNYSDKQVTTSGNNIIKLTDREAEILQLVCNGLSNTEIADKLFLSLKTVEGHKTKLLKKSSTKNTAGLIMFAIKSGLITV